MIKALAFLLLAGSLAAAETRTYLVKRAEHFPDDKYILVPSPQEYKKFIDTGKAKWADADGQPFRLTSYDINYNGKYAIWRVTYVNDVEKSRMDDYDNKKWIVLLSSMNVVMEATTRGQQPRFASIELAPYPTDYYQVFPSTP